MIYTSSTNTMISYFRTSPHNSNCYSQGIFFLNDTHVFESCGMYGLSYFHVLEYHSTESEFSLNQTFQSDLPYRSKVFLEGATQFNNHIYVLTWKEHIVFKLSNQEPFELQS